MLRLYFRTHLIDIATKLKNPSETLCTRLCEFDVLGSVCLNELGLQNGSTFLGSERKDLNVNRTGARFAAPQQTYVLFAEALGINHLYVLIETHCMQFGENTKLSKIKPILKPNDMNKNSIIGK